ncbi:MAG: hypothetical protein AW09_002193 [Candidatus Accumulibacter phosphatis]|uniref:Uncharacterized protein n=1 Tax=Candidatus Accumulibacter phosphatis TaxID=327160 RepID=A0A080LVD8_9PROT|nr:MAG: hypothetical protein AW09_002193 [Candidatus Accumulibacter phosphatis]
MAIGQDEPVLGDGESRTRVAAANRRSVFLRLWRQHRLQIPLVRPHIGRLSLPGLVIQRLPRSQVDQLPVYLDVHRRPRIRSSNFLRRHYILHRLDRRRSRFRLRFGRLNLRCRGLDLLVRFPAHEDEHTSHHCHQSQQSRNDVDHGLARLHPGLGNQPFHRFLAYPARACHGRGGRGCFAAGCSRQRGHRRLTGLRRRRLARVELTRRPEGVGRRRIQLERKLGPSRSELDEVIMVQGDTVADARAIDKHAIATVEIDQREALLLGIALDLRMIAAYRIVTLGVVGHTGCRVATKADLRGLCDRKSDLLVRLRAGQVSEHDALRSYIGIRRRPQGNLAGRCRLPQIDLARRLRSECRWRIHLEAEFRAPGTKLHDVPMMQRRVAGDPRLVDENTIAAAEVGEDEDRALCGVTSDPGMVAADGIVTFHVIGNGRCGISSERYFRHLIEGKADLLICFGARKVLDDDTFHPTILPVSATRLY